MAKQKPSSAMKKCIFCGRRRKMTAEHIWGDWLKAYVKIEMNKHHFEAIKVPAPGAPTTSVVRIKAGDPLRSKVRVVCEECNNRWLSEIQNSAKPFLIPLIEGKKCVLGKIAQERVAAWCAMATMTAEYIDPDPTSIAVPQRDRDWLMANGTAPPGWKIWIGRYQRHKWVGRWIHMTLPILEGKEIPAPEDKKPLLPNSQITTFTVGQLYVHVMSSTIPNMFDGWRWGWGPAPQAGRLLAQIHPPKESMIVWPPTSLTDASADGIAAGFERYIDAISRSMTGRRIF